MERALSFTSEDSPSKSPWPKPEVTKKIREQKHIEGLYQGVKNGQENNMVRNFTLTQRPSNITTGGIIKIKAIPKSNTCRAQ